LAEPSGVLGGKNSKLNLRLSAINLAFQLLRMPGAREFPDAGFLRPEQ
jgi:hypothetical protein